MDQAFTSTMNLLAEPSRALMLLKLLNGQALPAGELAVAANVSPQTASGHLAKLINARLLVVESQGRHRYYRLAGTEVADALEAILVLLPQAGARSSAPKIPVVGTVAHARTCYSHLAGWLGVSIADALQKNGYLTPSGNRAFQVTAPGREWFECLGIPVPKQQHAPSSKDARQCLDWTERRPHLAGTLGVSLYRRLLELRWIAGLANTRLVRVTHQGRQELWDQLGVPSGQ